MHYIRTHSRIRLTSCSNGIAGIRPRSLGPRISQSVKVHRFDHDPRAPIAAEIGPSGRIASDTPPSVDRLCSPRVLPTPLPSPPRRCRRPGPVDGPRLSRPAAKTPRQPIFRRCRRRNGACAARGMVRCHLEPDHRLFGAQPGLPPLRCAARRGPARAYGRPDRASFCRAGTL